MLTYFSVQGFKNFREKLIWDLHNTGKYAFNAEQIRDGIINKGIIYGKNGEGKSNLGKAIFDIEYNVAYAAKGLTPDGAQAAPMLNGIYRTVGYKDDISFEYRFRFGEDTIAYSYKKKDFNRIVEETVVLNGSEILTYQAGKNLTCRIPEAQNVVFSNMTPGGSPLFFLFNFIKFDSKSPLGSLYSFVKGMLWFRCLNQGNEAIGFQVRPDLLEHRIIKENKIDDFEKFLRSHGIDYELEQGQTNGLFKSTPIIVAKFGKEKAPLVQLLSTGTMALELFYYWSLLFKDVTFLFIDEFDAFYHYELSANLVSYLNGEKGFQSFLTTHNTSLMSTRLMRPDTLFLLSDNKIKPLCECTEAELREGHNLEKIYRNGGFEE